MLKLESYFAETVAAGWRPRNPCTDERELLRLEASVARGTCLEPIVIAGDVLYVDSSQSVELCDLVSFSLSQRGADAQNSALPPGQTAWSKGDRWVKLLARYHEFDMLLEKYGSAATATLLSCESADDTPILHPVRQIRRNGQLLFGPDTHSPQLSRRSLLLGAAVAPLALAGCGDEVAPFIMLPACTEGTSSGSQLGQNSATFVQTTTVAGPVTIAHSHTPPPAIIGTTIASLVVVTDSSAATVVVTVTGFYTNTTTTSTAGMYALQYGVTTTSGAVDYGTNPVSVSDYIDSLGDSASGPVSQEITFSQAASTTTTYYLNALASPTPSTLQISNVIVKAEGIKR